MTAAEALALMADHRELIAREVDRAPSLPAVAVERLKATGFVAAVAASAAVRPPAHRAETGTAARRAS